MTTKKNAAGAAIIEYSREEIMALKNSWKRNPCYDLYDCSHFSLALRAELKAYQEEVEAAWKAEIEAAVKAYALEIGCHINLKLAEKIQSLEERINVLEAGV